MFIWGVAAAGPTWLRLVRTSGSGDGGAGVVQVVG
jgi:hypothetical protein